MRFSLFRRAPAVPVRRLIVGLGNPGPEYANTRHNVGFRVIDRLAERHRLEVRRLEKRALTGRGRLEDEEVVLAKPQTFMNLSGESVAPLMRLLDLQPADLLVITDDLDLPVGRLRLRETGGAGGHNGLKSLIQHLRTEDFPRLRIGVGRPAQGERGAVVDHVLSKFARHELEPIAQAIDAAADAVEAVAREGLTAAMNRVNQR